MQWAIEAEITNSKTAKIKVSWDKDEESMYGNSD